MTLFKPWKCRLPWLHSQRAEVLAALALSVRLRQPLAPGLARLAEVDPSLQSWHQRLDAGLRSGEPLGGLLYRQRLLDKKSAHRLDAAVDPVVEFEALTCESYAPLRGLFLIRWFPVILAMTMCLPLVALQVSQLASFFEHIYLDMGIKLPGITLMIFNLSRGSTGLLVGCAGCVMFGIIAFLSAVRGLRHIRHCMWVEVCRAEAILTLITAAQRGADTPVMYRWPLNWLATLRLTVFRQGRPAWDAQWRTYRILTRWRETELGWRKAARSPTALGVLQALAMISETCDQQELKNLEHMMRDRLHCALEPAVAQAWAILVVSVAVGCVVAIVAMTFPIISTVEQMG